MRIIVIIALIVLMMLGGYALRTSFDVGADAESVRGLVASAGWLGPLMFVALFAVRPLLLLPTIVLLTAGGIGFGFVGGMVLGAAGLTLAALVKFAIAMLAGREWLIERMPEAWRLRLATFNRRNGAGVLALVTAYPIGPAEMLQTAAILGGIRLVPLLASVGSGSLVRAGSFSYFGDTVVDGRGLVFAGAILIALAGAPLAVPRWRRALRGR